jgi:hypothetical protein
VAIPDTELPYRRGTYRYRDVGSPRNEPRAVCVGREVRRRLSGGSPAHGGCSSDSATTAAGSSSGTPSVEHLLSVALQRADLSAGSWATTQEARNVSASSGSGSEQACDGVAPADPHIRVVISGAHFEDASTGVAVSSVVQL